MQKEAKDLKQKQKQDNSQGQSMILCKHCGRPILAANYLIHQARCLLMNNRTQIPEEQQKLQPRDKQTFQHGSKFERTQQKKEQVAVLNQQKIINTQKLSKKREKQSTQKEEELQKIPCLFCGYPQNLAELDTHPSQCEHRQQECQECSNKFPKSLMQQHHTVCRNRRPVEHNQRDQRWIHQMREHQEDQDYNPFGNFRNMFMCEPRPLRQGYTVIQRSDGRGNVQRRIILGQPQGFGQRQNSAAHFANFFAILEFMAARGSNQHQGLTKEEIKNLARFKYYGNNIAKKQGDKDLCTICYCEFQKDEKLVQLKCKHAFHDQCITKWVQKTAKCPVCKTAQTNRPIFHDQQLM